MSASGGVRAAAHAVSMESAAAPHAPPAPAFVRTRRPIALSIGISRWTRYAWGTIAAVVAFVAMTCWWLSQDRNIPIYDAGNHLGIALQFREMILAGNLLGPFEYVSVYPPLGHIVGMFGALIGGVSVAAPIIANNIVFISLLALGSYRTGRLLFGSAAGMLAAVVALASPLLIENIHVFMLDPPLTALVAVSVWLLLASEDFKRVDVSAVAGLATAGGMLIKVQFAGCIAGLVLFMLLSGGWRNLRGFATFVAVAVVLGAPWYLDHLSIISAMLEVANAHPTNTAVAVPPQPGNIPPTLSIKNLLWYFWSVVNLQLTAALSVAAIGGTLWMVVNLVRRRKASDPGERRTQHLRLEFMAGGFLTWLALTLTPHHDVRYGMPLLAYVAVVATGWIIFLPRAPRIAAIALVALGVGLNTLGITFGVGHEKTIALASAPPSTQQFPDRIILYPTTGFLSAGPIRNGDLPDLFKDLHRNGVRTVSWSFEQSRQANFSFEGLLVLATIAGLQPAITGQVEFSRSPEVATLIHVPIGPNSPPTCARVKNVWEVFVNRYEPGVTGVWIARYDPAAGKMALYCPTRSPQYYAIGKV